MVKPPQDDARATVLQSGRGSAIFESINSFLIVPQNLFHLLTDFFLLVSSPFFDIPNEGFFSSCENWLKSIQLLTQIALFFYLWSKSLACSSRCTSLWHLPSCKCLSVLTFQFPWEWTNKNSHTHWMCLLKQERKGSQHSGIFRRKSS